MNIKNCIFIFILLISKNISCEDFTGTISLPDCYKYNPIIDRSNCCFMFWYRIPENIVNIHNRHRCPLLSVEIILDKPATLNGKEYKKRFLINLPLYVFYNFNLKKFKDHTQNISLTINMLGYDITKYPEKLFLYGKRYKNKHWLLQLDGSFNTLEYWYKELEENEI